MTEGADPPASSTRDRLWLVHMRLGFAIFTIESAAVAGYLQMAPHEPHRELLTAIAAAVALASAMALALAPRISRRGWIPSLSIVWTLFAGVTLAVFAHLDGGIGSPLLELIVLPLFYASLAYEPAAVVVCGAAAVTEMACVVAADPGIHRPWRALTITSAAVVGLAVMAVVASINRRQSERRQHDLAGLLEEAATHDDLTGCLNHRAFDKALDDEIQRAQRFDQPLSLLIADLDGFQSVNDRLGHPAGDEVLAAVGAALRRNIRSTDIAARIGGDTFAILLPSTTTDGALAQRRRIRAAIDATHPALAGISIGTALLNHTDPRRARLLRDADHDMYREKATKGSHHSGEPHPVAVAIAPVGS